MLLRYEDFVAHPAETLGRVADLAGAERGPGDLAFVRGEQMDLRPNHTVDGNPMRFSVGPVTLRPDEEWRTRMEPVDRRVVTALTLPLLRRYRYGARAAG